MKYEIKFTNKEVTPWSGLGFLHNMMQRMGIRDKLSQLDYLPKPNSNRGYSPVDIIESFMVSVWCGASRFLHTEITRHDKALIKIFGWKRAPGNDTFKRFFKKFNLFGSKQLSDSLFTMIFKDIQFDNYTLDCDSSVVTRFGGQQEGAVRGYNPQEARKE